MANAQTKTTTNPLQEMSQMSQMELANYAASLHQLLQQQSTTLPSSSTTIMSMNNDNNNGNQEVPSCSKNLELEQEVEAATEDEKDKWTDSNLEIFIEVIRNNKCLWDVNHDEFKNKHMRIAAWENISILFERDGK